MDWVELINNILSLTREVKLFFCVGELLWVKMWVNVVDCNEARLSTLPRTLIHIGEPSVAAAQLSVAFSYVYCCVHVCYGCIAVTVQLSAE